MIRELFGKRKKKEELDRSFERVISKIHNIEDRDNPKKLRHYIVDCC